MCKKGKEYYHIVQKYGASRQKGPDQKNEEFTMGIYCFYSGIIFEKKLYSKTAYVIIDDEIDDKTRYCFDTRDGERVLALYEDVPTFDSGDRMYDSIHKAYVKRVGNELIALYIVNGYVLSKADLFLGVKPVNEDAKQILRDAGFSE